MDFFRGDLLIHPAAATASAAPRPIRHQLLQCRASAAKTTTTSTTTTTRQPAEKKKISVNGNPSSAASRSSTTSESGSTSTSTSASASTQVVPSSSSASASASSSSSLTTLVEEAIATAGKAVAGIVCDAVEDFIARNIDIDPRQLPPSQDPKVQLAGNFAPVEQECPPQPCRVIGTIPRCLLGGAYIRNGSNPRHPPASGYNYFDGDGMLHSVKFPSSSSSSSTPPIYCARFTKTSRYIQEEAAGKPLFPNFLGNMSNHAGLARLGLYAMRVAMGVIDPEAGYGSSNAGMAYFDGKILAMSEEDQPYAVKLTDSGDLETLGRYNFHRGLSLPMCAHPKKDPVTGQLFAFSYNPFLPHLRYFWASPQGRKSPDFDVWLQQPCLFHDFAITERYAIFPENQLVMRLQDLLLHNKPPLTGDSSKITRFGVIPRIHTARSQPLKWIDVPDWTSFHYLNAWEEGDQKVVVLASAIGPLECLFDDLAGLSNRLWEIHLDLRSGRSTRQHVCSATIDFGQINQRFMGRKNRYAYLCSSGPWPRLSGLVKIDLEAPRLPRITTTNGSGDPGLQEPCVAASRKFGAGRFCSEPYFVPRTEEADAEEDDGYILSFVHDEERNISELLIMDAKSPTLDTVAAIQLPARVPYGFHGTFVTQKELHSQTPL